NQDIGNWNTANVTTMSNMFNRAYLFNQPIGNWNTSKVTTMALMFWRAYAFNQSVSSWNTSHVTDASSVFGNATSFNQNVGSWNVANVTNMAGMFNGASAFSRTNYDALLLGWSAQNVKTGLSFHAGSAKYSLNSAVVAARAALSPGKSWTITDGGGEAVTPSAPTSVSGTAGSSQVSLSWTAPSETGGSAITDYVVQYQLASGGSWTIFADGTSTNTVATVTSLTPGTSYIFQVAAVNAAGEGSYTSSSAPVTPYTVPGAPTGVSGISGNTQVILSWNAPASNGGALITDYAIQYSSNGSTWISFTDGESTNTTTVVTGLANGTEYTFKVAAINAAGTGTYSESSLGVTPITTPSAPTLVTGTAGDEQVALSWTAPSSNGGSAITGYKVEYQLASGGAWTVFSDNTSTSTNLTVTGLTNNTSYIFRVAAKNLAGAGSYSESSSAVTPQGAFVSTWNTNNTSTGSSASNQITLPLESTGTYNFTVDWGDGTQNTITSGTDANRTHTYATAGTYT
ncbi:MAG: BspA family leucine-rich repeat surface protein, partial [Proteobacteria bacterium]|nr:BspA family leucine-rich repeat surface protein [Pseudomonadota bacterium]